MATNRDLTNKLVGLKDCSFPELRLQFRTLHKAPAPPAFSKEMVARLIAQRLQEQALGKLDRELVGLLDRHARGARSQRYIKTGSVLVREHDGTTHEVMVIPEGFLWNDTVYGSLSSIAKRITGTEWNGPRFFGLRGRTGQQTKGSNGHA